MVEEFANITLTSFYPLVHLMWVALAARESGEYKFLAGYRLFKI